MDQNTTSASLIFHLCFNLVLFPRQSLGALRTNVTSNNCGQNFLVEYDSIKLHLGVTCIILNVC